MGCNLFLNDLQMMIKIIRLILVKYNNLLMKSNNILFYF